MPVFRFDDRLAMRIRISYEKGERVADLAKRYNCNAPHIYNTIKRAGGKIRPAAKYLRFSSEDSKNILRAYKNGDSSSKIADNFNVSANTIRRFIRLLGGRIRPQGNNGSNKKYFRNPSRETALFTLYRLTASDTDFLHARQRGLCLWCRAILPVDSLNCFVDHIGGEETFKDKNSVRGLCCPDDICNLIAGKIEKNGSEIKNWKLLTPLIRHIKYVIKTNHGKLFKGRK
jgi:Mor family transcriptional regulator